MMVKAEYRLTAFTREQLGGETELALSEREQKVLDELAQQLNSEDPDFASQMSLDRSTPEKQFSAKNIVIGVLLAVVGLGVVLVGVNMKFIWLGVIGFILIAGGVFLASKRSSRKVSSQSGSSASQQGSSSQSASGFMKNLEDKWDQRHQ